MSRAIRVMVGAVILLGGVSAVRAGAVEDDGLPSQESSTAYVAFTGDVLIHGVVSRQAAVYGQPFDFRPMLEEVAPIIGGVDVAVCHLEVPLSIDNSDLSTYPLFNAPRQVADGLAAAGFDGCSTASNHSMDQGPEGVGETIDALDSTGLSYAGTAMEADQGWDATYYRVGDLKIAHISATYWLNGLRMPADSPWMVQLIDTDQILTIAGLARLAGADLVVVSIHCCVEFQQDPTPAQHELAHRLLASASVDLVVSHHSHLVGPVEMIRGEYALHGLGNLLSAQRQLPGASDGVIAVARVEKSGEAWEIVEVEAVPTYVERGTYRVLPALPGSESYLRTMASLSSWGVQIAEFEPISELFVGGRVR